MTIGLNTYASYYVRVKNQFCDQTRCNEATDLIVTEVICWFRNLIAELFIGCFQKRDCVHCLISY